MKSLTGTNTDDRGLPDNDKHEINELEQEKMLLEEISNNYETAVNKTNKKFYFIIALIAITVSAGFVSYTYYENQITSANTSHLFVDLNSDYVIQNLKGDTLKIWVAWNIPSSRTLVVGIINTANLPQDKIDIIKDAILSTKTITLDDSLLNKGPQGTSSVYYTGWEGALTDAYSYPTASYIPQKFNIISSPNGPAGDIEIILTNDVNPDGLSGLTKSITDGNEILKSKITIYKASELSYVQLETIVRHEFGHAMGLAHSTATEDLMHATIQTNYPYISGCDIDAIKDLYNGSKNSVVVCQK